MGEIVEIKINGSLIEIGPWQIEINNGKLIIRNMDEIIQTTTAEFPFEIYTRGEVKELHAKTIKLPL